MAELSKIETTIWSKSIKGYGLVETGIECIKQRMDIAIRTGKGTSALRPLFGTDVYKYQDKPVNIVVPNVKSEILRAIMLFVPEVKIKKINHFVYNGQVVFEVTCLLLIDLSEFVYVYNPIVVTGVNSNLILRGVFPDNPLGFSYGITLVLNGIEKKPGAPETGFSSWSEVFIWVKLNWWHFGEWVLTAVGLVLYVKDKQYTSGSINIYLLTSYKIMAVVPGLSFGENYNITITPTIGGSFVDAGVTMPTIGDLINWLNTNWSVYGVWSLESALSDFNEDFNNDFSKYVMKLVLVTDTYKDAEINILTV